MDGAPGLKQNKINISGRQKLVFRVFSHSIMLTHVNDQLFVFLYDSLF